MDKTVPTENKRTYRENGATVTVIREFEREGSPFVERLISLLMEWLEQEISAESKKE